MKILQIHNRYRERGGEDTVVAAEADLLREAGHVVCQFQAENPSGHFRSATTLAMAPWNLLAARRVKEVAESFQPDLAHVHNTWYSLTPSVLSALEAASVPVVMTLHNYRLMCTNAQLFRDGKPCELCVGNAPWQGIRYRCYRGSTLASVAVAATIAINHRRSTWERSVSKFVALTEFAKSRFVAAGLPTSSIHVKPNFVEDPGPRANQPSASSEVLFVGRLSPEKGLAEVLAVWETSAPPGLELVVIGDGPERARLELHTDGVRFLGRLDPLAVREHLLRSRALLFPSKWYEGQPMVLLEAFAAGLPVLGSDLGSIAEILRPTPEWLVDNWQEAIARLASDRGLDSAGSTLRETYERCFAPAVGLRLLEDLYGSALEEAVSNRDD